MLSRHVLLRTPVPRGEERSRAMPCHAMPRLNQCTAKYQLMHVSEGEELVSQRHTELVVDTSCWPQMVAEKTLKLKGTV